MWQTLTQCANLEALRVVDHLDSFPLHEIVVILRPLIKLCHLSVLWPLDDVATRNQDLLAKVEAHSVWNQSALYQMWEDPVLKINWVSHGISYMRKLAVAVADHNAAGGCLQSICGRSTADWSVHIFKQNCYQGLGGTSAEPNLLL